MTKKKSYIDKEIEHINETIGKLKSTNSKLNSVMVAVLILFVLVFISNLNSISIVLLLFAGLMYYIFSVQIKYNNTKKELDKIKSKFSKR